MKEAFAWTQRYANDTLVRAGASSRKAYRPHALPYLGLGVNKVARGGVSSTIGSRKVAGIVASTERDPLGGSGGCAPPENREFAIFWPRSFREAATSVNSLQQGYVVVVNVSNIPQLDEQQRAVDFIAGGCYALGGQQDMLAESIFFFTPKSTSPQYEDEDTEPHSDLRRSKAARNALISLARSDLKTKIS